MATYENINSNLFDWVEVNTLAGVSVGSEFTIQNIGSEICYIRESSDKPTQSEGAMILPLYSGEMSKAYIAAGSSKIWIKPTLSGNLVKLAIYS